MKYLLVYLKGVAMGAADVVPGVSGGTIAFISGIYETLIQALRSFDVTALQYILKLDIKNFWKHINGTFLVSLLAGIATSILLLSKLVLFLLDQYPVMIWSFFFGLILASIVLVSKTIKKINFTVILMGIIGIIVAYISTIGLQVQTPDDLWFIFVSGVIAICAMILPGISGSFLLVILGKYEYILEALHDKNIPVIVVFGVGCVIGLLSFSHFLNWLLKKYHNEAIALLTGFMIGAMNKVWAWKHTITTYTYKGKVKPLVTENVLPFEYEQLTGQNSHWIECIVLMFVGFGLVYVLERFAKNKANE